jgi:hypothetical protein
MVGLEAPHPDQHEDDEEKERPEDLHHHTTLGKKIINKINIKT